MANVWYAKGIREIGDGGVDLLTDNLKVVLYDSGYTPVVDTDEFLSDIPSGARIVTSPNLASKTVTDGGILDCADPVFTSVPSAEIIVGAALFKDTGSAATSPLLAKIDNAGGLPLTTDGTNITMSVDGAGLAKL